MTSRFVHNIHVIDYAGYLSVHVFLCTLIPLWTVVVDVSTVHVLLGSEISYTGLDRAIAARLTEIVVYFGGVVDVIRGLHKNNKALRYFDAQASMWTPPLTHSTI